MSTGQQIGLIGSSVRVQSLPTASAATFGEGNRFYTLIGQQVGYITGHTYRTVVANDVYSWEDVGNALMLLALVDGTITASSSIEVALSNFSRQPLVDDTLIVFSNASQYALMKVSAVTSTAATLIVKDNSAANIVSTKGIDGEEGLAFFSIFSGTFVQSAEVGFSLNSFNRTPKPGEEFIAFSIKNQYALFHVNSITAQFAKCSALHIISTKGETGATGAAGVGVTNATAGTPTVADGKTTTPITFSLSDGSTKQVNVEAKNGVDGQSNYNDLSNIPVINQDLTASGFTPVTNTYYKHTGTTTDLYTNGVIYFYNGTKYASLDGSTAVAERVTVAVADWELDGAVYAQVPTNPTAIGDTLATLYFDTTKTPDFTKFDWNKADSTSEYSWKSITLINSSTYKARVLRYSSPVTYIINVCTSDSISPYSGDSVYGVGNGNILASASAPNGWGTTNTSVSAGTVTAVNAQDIWGEYVSKDNRWKQAIVGANSTIPPFAYRATKTIGTKMGANSVVSLGYGDTASMRECANSGVAIGEVPTDSGNEITFYSVAKPTKALKLVVEIAETTSAITNIYTYDSMIDAFTSGAEGDEWKYTGDTDFFEKNAIYQKQVYVASATQAVSADTAVINGVATRAVSGKHVYVGINILEGTTATGFGGDIKLASSATEATLKISRDKIEVVTNNGVEKTITPADMGITQISSSCTKDLSTTPNWATNIPIHALKSTEVVEIALRTPVNVGSVYVATTYLISGLVFQTGDTKYVLNKIS